MEPSILGLILHKWAQVMILLDAGADPFQEAPAADVLPVECIDLFRTQEGSPVRELMQRLVNSILGHVCRLSHIVS